MESASAIRVPPGFGPVGFWKIDKKTCSYSIDRAVCINSINMRKGSSFERNCLPLSQCKVETFFVAIDDAGVFYFATNDGLILWDRFERRLERYRSHANQPSSLLSNDLNARLYRPIRRFMVWNQLVGRLGLFQTCESVWPLSVSTKW